MEADSGFTEVRLRATVRRVNSSRHKLDARENVLARVVASFSRRAKLSKVENCSDVSVEDSIRLLSLFDLNSSIHIHMRDQNGLSLLTCIHIRVYGMHIAPESLGLS